MLMSRYSGWVDGCLLCSSSWTADNIASSQFHVIPRMTSLSLTVSLCWGRGLRHVAVLVSRVIISPTDGLTTVERL